MRKSTFLSICLLSAACTATDRTTPEQSGANPAVTDRRTDVEKAVVEETKRLCRYAVTFDTVSKILNEVGVPYVSAAGTVASKICAAVLDGTKDLSKPKVGTVEIEGRFISG